MLDVAVAYNRYRFLGNEFLTWLWFVISTDQQILRKSDHDLLSMEIGNRMVLENRQGTSIETVTIKGDEAGLEEGGVALQKGAHVSEIHLIYKTGSDQFSFTLKGESLSISNLKLPDTGPVESADDVDGLILEKTFMYEKVFILIDGLFDQFIQLRLSDSWQQHIIPKIRVWMKQA